MCQLWCSCSTICSPRKFDGSRLSFSPSLPGLTMDYEKAVLHQCPASSSTGCPLPAELQTAFSLVAVFSGEHLLCLCLFQSYQFFLSLTPPVRMQGDVWSRTQTIDHTAGHQEETVSAIVSSVLSSGQHCPSYSLVHPHRDPSSPEHSQHLKLLLTTWRLQET